MPPEKALVIWLQMPVKIDVTPFQALTKPT